MDTIPYRFYGMREMTKYFDLSLHTPEFIVKNIMKDVTDYYEVCINGDCCFFPEVETALKFMQHKIEQYPNKTFTLRLQRNDEA